MLRFVWDAGKAERNLRKHGVSFDEAKTVFLDPLATTVDDPVHSTDEERFVTVGTTTRGRLLVVVHVEIDTSTVRLISARPATMSERQHHEES